MGTLPEFKIILYATDLGEHTRPVFRNALSLAKKFNSEIIMLHVVEPMSSSAQTIVDTYLNEVDSKKVKQDGMRKVLRQMEERLKIFCENELHSHTLESVHVKEILVTSGNTSEEIIKAAEKNNADLIVIGKSTQNILGRDVVGSATRRVSRHSSIPVLIIPDPDKR